MQVPLEIACPDFELTEAIRSLVKKSGADLDRLTVGCGVHFVEKSGEEGPQASTVKLVDKPGVRVARPRDHGEEPPF